MRGDDVSEIREIRKMVNDPERLLALADRRIFGIEGDTDEEATMRECAAAWEADRAELVLLREAARQLDPIDRQTAASIANFIDANRVPSPWRDSGVRLKEFGTWLRAVATSGAPDPYVAVNPSVKKPEPK
jgi:hypothetical protein